MITYGPCADGAWRIKRPGKPFIAGCVYRGMHAERLCAKQAQRLAGGGRIVKTTYALDFVPPDIDDAAPVEDLTRKASEE